jgi:hypothetical protein
MGIQSRLQTNAPPEWRPFAKALKISGIIARAGQRRDFARGSRAQAPWARTLVNRYSENRP